MNSTDLSWVYIQVTEQASVCRKRARASWVAVRETGWSLMPHTWIEPLVTCAAPSWARGIRWCVGQSPLTWRFIPGGRQSRKEQTKYHSMVSPVPAMKRATMLGREPQSRRPSTRSLVAHTENARREKEKPSLNTGAWHGHSFTHALIHSASSPNISLCAGKCSGCWSPVVNRAGSNLSVFMDIPFWAGKTATNRRRGNARLGALQVGRESRRR